MNPELELLQPYPFEKLKRLLKGAVPAELPAVSLAVGEPRHPAPTAALAALTGSLDGFGRYPSTRGNETLRESFAAWLGRRYGLPQVEQLAEQHILPLNGTREGLFAVAQCLLDRSVTDRDVLMPNPFYQIYEGAALLAGCHPAFYAIGENADDDIDAISDAELAKAQMIYICSPGNPTGAVLSKAALIRLIERARRHRVIIVSDECYGEIYRENAGPPCGLLEAAHAAGLDDYAGCLAFHSLSKRSNLPGLRSGFVSGDAELIQRFLTYRTYHGCSMGEPVQAASAAAWNDEAHVIENRAAYDAKYVDVVERLASQVKLTIPPGGFYLWPELPLDDQALTRTLFEEQHVRVVPGSYLARDQSAPSGTVNPGRNRLRLALVAPLEDCRVAADRIVASLASHPSS